jgi:hypothetical protein
VSNSRARRFLSLKYCYFGILHFYCGSLGKKDGEIFPTGLHIFPEAISGAPDRLEHPEGKFRGLFRQKLDLKMGESPSSRLVWRRVFGAGLRVGLTFWAGGARCWFEIHKDGRLKIRFSALPLGGVGAAMSHDFSWHIHCSIAGAEAARRAVRRKPFGAPTQVGFHAHCS